ncbi:hypothetical protein, partial [Caldalkalibacillus salinus]|uniref:hypothetical protein n=1 Tax=Caldalkalibacillus salinus TaxID=2803787 RepID=UPI0019231754
MTAGRPFNERSEKPNYRKKLLPVLMSMSLATSAFISAGASVSAQEAGELSKQAYNHHGQLVSQTVRELEGSHKGWQVRDIATDKVKFVQYNKDHKVTEVEADTDTNVEAGTEEAAVEAEADT